jgi:pyridoxine 5-phosphate synthase
MINSAVNMHKIRLGVNIDHVATVRNARGGNNPDPVRAAKFALEAGADGITAHLREDRRHILDDDMWRLKSLCEQENKPLNFEMAPTEEMLTIVLKTKPHAACLVPERRQERTTEGGLNLLEASNDLRSYIQALKLADIRVSLFIAPTQPMIAKAYELGADIVEFHTGSLTETYHLGLKDQYDNHLETLRLGCSMAHGLGLEVHAGHGIDFETVGPIAACPEIVELNIGHFLIGEAIFIGLHQAILQMRQLIDQGRLV